MKYLFIFILAAILVSCHKSQTDPNPIELPVRKFHVTVQNDAGLTSIQINFDYPVTLGAVIYLEWDEQLDGFIVARRAHMEYFVLKNRTLHTHSGLIFGTDPLAEIRNVQIKYFKPTLIGEGDYSISY